MRGNQVVTSTTRSLMGRLQMHEVSKAVPFGELWAAFGWMSDRVDAEAAIKVGGRSEQN